MSSCISDKLLQGHFPVRRFFDGRLVRIKGQVNFLMPELTPFVWLTAEMDGNSTKSCLMIFRIFFNSALHLGLCLFLKVCTVFARCEVWFGHVAMVLRGRGRKCRELVGGRSPTKM